MFVPTRVAKLVSPEASFTVAAAPSVPTNPVKRSTPVVVVMPFTGLCVPEGKVKRTVPARRWVIGPRFSTRSLPVPEIRSMDEKAPVLPAAAAGKMRPATFWTMSKVLLPWSMRLPPRSSMTPFGLSRLETEELAAVV